MEKLPPLIPENGPATTLVEFVSQNSTVHVSPVTDNGVSAKSVACSGKLNCFAGLIK